MRATAQQAIDAFRSVDTCTPGLCLTYVVKAWAAPSIGCPDAITSWEWALDKHPGDRDPPPGAPVYYRGGQYGHIAMALGGGRIRSTDCQSTGRIGDVGLAWPEQAWSYPYLGWTGDLSKQPLPLGPSTDGDDEIVKPTDVVGKDSDGTDLTMGEAMARLNWLYQQFLEAGSVNQQLDRIETNTR